MPHPIIRLHLLTMAAAWTLPVVLAAPPTPSSWRELLVRPTEDDATRMRVEVFFVTGDADRLAPIQDRQAGWGTSATEMLTQLGEYGEAQKLSHFEDWISLEAENEWTSVTRMPLPAKGRSVNFESCGGTLKLIGSWRRDDDGWKAPIDLEFELTAPVSANADQTQPEAERQTEVAVVKSRVSMEAEVAEGRPTILVGGLGQATKPPADAQEKTNDAAAGIVVVRLTLSREDMPEEEAVPLAEGDPKDGQIMFSLEVFSLEGEPNKLAAFRDEQLAALGDARAETVLARLGEFGQTELLSRPNVLVNEHAVATVTVGERVPVAPSTPSQDDPPEISYQDVGLSLELSGEWMDSIQTGLARVTCRLALSHVVTDESANGRPRIVRTNRAYEGPAWSGEATWLPSRAAWLRQGERMTLVLMRLTARRPKPSQTQADAPTSRPGEAEAPAHPPRARVDLWKIESDQDAALDLDWERMLGERPASDESSDLPEGMGRAQRLATAKGVVDGQEALTATFGEEPGPEAWEDDQDPAHPRDLPAFAHVGVQGTWLRCRPNTARLLVGTKTVNLPDTDRPEGSPPAGIRIEQAEECVELQVGEAVWIGTTWRKAKVASTGKPEPFVMARVKLVSDDAEISQKKQPASAAQSSELEVSVFEFECPVEAFLKLDSASLEEQSPTADALLANLNAMGAAKRVRQGRQRVGDLSLGSEITSGERVPLVAAPRPTAGGRWGSEVRYGTLGTEAGWCGLWFGGDRDRAAVDLTLKHASTRSTPLLPGVVLPISAQLRTEVSSVLTARRPSILICSRGSQPDPTRVACDVIQVAASRPRSAGEGSPRESARAALAGRRAEQAARVRVEVFATQLTADQLRALPESALANLDTPGVLFDILQELGPTRLLAGFDGSLLLDGENQVRQRERVPMPRRSGRASSISYGEAGYQLILSGRWCENMPGMAQVRCSFECSDVLSDEDDAGLYSPILGQYRAQEQLWLEEGRPRVSLATQLIDTTPGQERFRLVTRSLVLRRSPP